MAAQPERFVIFGMSRLALAVADRLRQERPGAELVVIADESEELAERNIRRITPASDRRQALEVARLEEAKAFLLLSDDDGENVRAALAGMTVAPNVPTVLHTFDPALADQLEEGARDGYRRDGGLLVRRAYSMSGLSAPFFLAHALEAENRLTMRFGDVELPILRLLILRDQVKTVADIVEKECEVVAVRRNGEWSSDIDDTLALQPGDEILIGGIHRNVFRFAFDNCNDRGRQVLKIGSRGESVKRVQNALHDKGFDPGPYDGIFGRRTAEAVRAFQHKRGLAVSGLVGPNTRKELWGRKDAPPGLSTLGALRRGKRNPINEMTLLPIVSVFLLFVLVTMAFVFSWRNSLDAVGGVYLGVRTAVGEQDFSDQKALFEFLGALTLVAGAALVGVVFSQLTAYLTSKRIGQTGSTLRVRRLDDHIVVAGLGPLGYQIARLLRDSDVDCAVLSPTPDDPFIDAVQEMSPVITGDIRLVENLTRAGIEKAICLIACSENNLANVEACMHAKRMADDLGRQLRTVARVFDDQVAERAAEAFGIDHTFAAVEVAAHAFFDAATDERAARPFSPDDEGGDWLGLRYHLDDALPIEELEAWRLKGLRVLAVRAGYRGSPVVSLSGLRAQREPLAQTSSLVVVGPTAIVEQFSREPRPAA